MPIDVHAHYVPQRILATLEESASEFGVSLSRSQTLEVARLVTDWHGQAGVDLPGVRVVRRGGRLEFGSREEN